MGSMEYARASVNVAVSAGRRGRLAKCRKNRHMKGKKGAKHKGDVPS